MADTHVVADYKVSLNELFLYVLVEGLCAIEARANDGDISEVASKRRDFLVGIMHVFGFTPMDPAVQVIVMRALETYATTSSAGDFEFATLGVVLLCLRPHPLLDRSKRFNTVFKCHNVMVSSIRAVMKVAQLRHRFRAVRLPISLPALRINVQLILLAALGQLDVRVSMPDGTTRTCSEWRARVLEVGSLVQCGTPPSLSTLEERRVNTADTLGTRWLGYVLDQLYVLWIALATAIIGVRVGELIDGQIASALEM